MMMFSTKTIPIIILIMLISLLSYGDSITLKNGMTIEGEITEKTEDYIIIKEPCLGGYTKTTFTMDEIESCDSKAYDREHYAEEQKAKGLIKHGNQWITQEQLDGIVEQERKEEEENKKRIKEIETKRMFEKEQREKGLVEYAGEWVTPLDKHEKEQEDKGLVKYEGKWITPEGKKEIERRNKEIERENIEHIERTQKRRSKMNILKNMLIVGIPLIIFLIVITALYINKMMAYKRIYNRYKSIIDVDREAEKAKTSLDKLKNAFSQLDREYKIKSDNLTSEYQKKRYVYEQLLKEISVLEEDLELTSFGLYKPHYSFDTPEQYKAKIEKTRNLQKQLIKDKNAAVCSTEWTVGGSKREGRKMTNQYLKLMLRAFNNESDAAVLKVKWNNVLKMEERLRKAFDAINTLGSTQNIEITQDYFNLKIGELRLTHEYQEKLHEEKEEQRRIREQMREEEKARREIETAQKESELDEKRYQDALEKAREEVSKAQGKELDKLNEQLAELEKRLQEARANKARALSRAQLTKSGHIYVISNIGSFGENVYKIGMTRRLDPTDRVKELGDASVPFEFDIHAMIYSENAPDLENILHKEFDSRRVNMTNQRKEFFKVSLGEIENIVHKKRGEIEFTKLAEAREYRETLAIIEKEINAKSIEEKVEERFPRSL